MGWTGHVAGMGDARNAYMALVGKSEGKILPGKTKTWDGG
jgi:hypothetical protein